MVIRVCVCDHADGLHIVDLDDEAAHTLKGQGACYESKCDCTQFREQVQLVHLVSHEEQLLGLDTQGRVWEYSNDDNVWRTFGWRWGQAASFEIPRKGERP